MLSTNQIMALLGLSRGYTLKLLRNARIRSEKQSCSPGGWKIYWHITEEQVLSGLLNEKDPQKIAEEQGAALVMLESLLKQRPVKGEKYASV